ncbi:MAG: DUF4430 domain-containing protein [Eubacterium sp.]
MDSNLISKISRFLLKNKKSIIITCMIVGALVFSFWYGGGSDSLHGWDISNTTSSIQNITDFDTVFSTESDIEPEKKGNTRVSDATSESYIENTDITDSDETNNETIEDNSQKATSEPENTYEDEEESKTRAQETTTSNISETTSRIYLDTETTSSAQYCTISISCAAILDNMSMLDSAKTDIVPENGWILEETKVELSSGDTVFDVLKKATKTARIHMEYSYTPIYDSVYIEGIANLYEFDCGELSGWMYSVNGNFPNYGSSQYAVEDGDEICWIYTCNLGGDVGNRFE